MDQKSTDRFSMDQPPSYSTPRMTEKRKTLAWTILVFALLVVIVVGATLIGVYMTQKHTEADTNVVQEWFEEHDREFKVLTGLQIPQISVTDGQFYLDVNWLLWFQVVEMAFQSQNGERVHQTVMVNNIENVAAFYVRIDNSSSTILYDYKRDIIGFRGMSSQKCYIMRMGNSKVLTMSDVLKSIQQVRTQNLTSDSDISYSLLQGERADRTKLGVPINLLCSDVPIYWATQDNSPQQRWELKFKFKLFKLKVDVTISS